MKESLTLIGIAALAVALWCVFMSLWFLRGISDEKIFESNGVTIKSLQNTIQAKEDDIAKNKILLDAANTTIESLQETNKASTDTIAKEETDLSTKDETIKSLQNTLQEKEAAFDKDQGDLAAKDETIRVLMAAVASAQEKLKALPQENASNENDYNIVEKVYPKDNGFDAQDLGAGFSAYQVFGPLNNPTQVPIPAKILKLSPWEFGNGNSGIAANGSGFYVAGATNGDNSGATSTSGQAAYLQFKGSSISQTIALSAGTYVVSFDFEGRRDYEPANQIEVSLDGMVLFQGAPTDCNTFKPVMTRSISLKKSGNHKLMFYGLGAVGDASGDHTTFIDNVVINRIDTKKGPSNNREIKASRGNLPG
jgi:hypothetical protein